MRQLANPSFLWIFIVLAVAIWFVFRRCQGDGAVYPPTGHLPRIPRSFRHFVADTTRIASITGIALLIVALARPQTRDTRIEEKQEAIAIQMVVDVSGSMAGLDLAAPETLRDGEFRTRLDVVKDAFSEFVRRRPHDAIGLITFGGYAVSRVPLTFDHDLLQHIINNVEIPGSEYDREGHLRRPEEQMTAIGDALALACARLENTDIASRIVVFLSDGESNFGIIDPDDAIRLADSMGIRVYTIAAGSEEMVPFLSHDPRGRPMIQRVFVGLDTDLLQRMAHTTGGRYFHVDDAAGMELALAAIDDMETTVTDQQIVEHTSEKQHWPLTLGLLLLIGAISIRCGVEGKLI